jgi:hypothetical protein
MMHESFPRDEAPLAWPDKSGPGSQGIVED